jgi:hypothetical protein
MNRAQRRPTADEILDAVSRSLSGVLSGYVGWKNTRETREQIRALAAAKLSVEFVSIGLEDPKP